MLNYVISGVSAVFALFSVIITYYVYKLSSKDVSYSDIDQQYNNLLEIGLNDPDLRDYDKTSLFYTLDSKDSFKKKYHIYANMCWNLVETIYDRQRDKKGRFKLSETWIPVMLEENRLHYSWFKHNLRLFKPEFQKFVTAELNDIEIIEGSISDLKIIYKKLEQDFASNELKSYNHLEKLMGKKKYKLLLARHRAFNESIGYALIYEIPGDKYLWLDYLAIDPKFQNAGYGTLLFNKISESRKGGILGVFLESEIPNSENQIIREGQYRRIKFYERLNARRLNIDYKLPTLSGGFPIYLYFRPSLNVHMLPKDQIKDSIASAYDYIHSDIVEKDNIFKGFADTIPDEYFS